MELVENVCPSKVEIGSKVIGICLRGLGGRTFKGSVVERKGSALTVFFPYSSELVTILA